MTHGDLGAMKFKAACFVVGGRSSGPRRFQLHLADTHPFAAALAKCHGLQNFLTAQAVIEVGMELARFAGQMAHDVGGGIDKGMFVADHVPRRPIPAAVRILARGHADAPPRMGAYQRGVAGTVGGRCCGRRPRNTPP